MYTILLILFVLTSVLLMLVILVQSSKGGGLGGAFGGGGQALFGGRGAAPFLIKATTYLATAYFLLALMLGVVSARQRGIRSDIERELAGVAGQLTTPGVPVSSALDMLSSDSAQTGGGEDTR